MRGNHDRHAGDPLPAWGFAVCDGPLVGPVWVLNHEPIEPVAGYGLAGHLHPAVQLVGRGRQRLKLPCFWLRPRCAILPAFGEFIDHGLVRLQSGDGVFVVTGTKVIKV